MKPHLPFRILRDATNALVVVSFILLLYSAGWEHSTRTYLKGFSDAIVPLSAEPIEKIASILAWMKNGPSRQATNAGQLSSRDPENTLNYQELLRVCGTATNAFVNLANSSGLPARRLLLLGPDHKTKHVVAEVEVGGRWIVADPSYRVLPRDAEGRPVTREQLRDPEVFAQATQGIPGYNADYTYDQTANVRTARIGVLGPLLGSAMQLFWPGWSGSVFWTILLERESFAALIAAALLLFFSLVLRSWLLWYGERRLGVHPTRIREQLMRVRWAMKGGPH